MTVAIEVLAPGLYTTVQDYPGRSGYRDQGVPASGPMDDWSFRLGNLLLGNPATAAGLEYTFSGPTLHFHSAGRICIAGPDTPAYLDGAAVSSWSAIDVAPGSQLKIGQLRTGVRGYLLVVGGLDAPRYLGSAATFCLADCYSSSGGAIRPLRTGDELAVADFDSSMAAVALTVPPLPDFTALDVVRVVPGPHGSEDFFSPDYLATFYQNHWQVSPDSNRSGLRLIGPQPGWLRANGADAGGHPSNIHDIPYQPGAINLAGNMPVILGPDGPTLGGFACLATVIRADRWKLGQIAPGQSLRFQPVSAEDALRLWKAREQSLPEPAIATAAVSIAPVQRKSPPRSRQVRVSGEAGLLIEYGADTPLSIATRVRLHALAQRLRGQAGITGVEAGARSLLVGFNPVECDSAALFAWLDTQESCLDATDIVIENRRVHLPLSWNDQAIQDAVRRYEQRLQQPVPWCPSNIDYLCRLNNLADGDALAARIFSSGYLVLALGDVYHGAPLATALDPRQRLVASKYNPPRTWTPPGAVGLGGACLCIYSCASPGGYQLIGRTLPVWNFAGEESPGLLQIFDEIHFYPASAAEVDALTADPGKAFKSLTIESGQFRLAEYLTSFGDCSPAPVIPVTETAAPLESEDGTRIPLQEEGANCRINARVEGLVSRLLTDQGARVRQGETLLLIDAMKIEYAIKAPCDGVVEKLACRAGDLVHAGQPLLTLRRRS